MISLGLNNAGKDIQEDEAYQRQGHDVSPPCNCTWCGRPCRERARVVGQVIADTKKVDQRIKGTLRLGWSQGRIAIQPHIHYDKLVRLKVPNAIATVRRHLMEWE